MPVVATSGLPAFEELSREGITVVDEDHAPALPWLHIGLLNLMPDAAMRATDRQFIRLASSISDDANVIIAPFTVAASSRGDEARDYVAAYYATPVVGFVEDLDALIITGANPEQPDLSDEPFWPGLVETMSTADQEQIPMLCSCLAAHAALQQYHAVIRARLPEKRWGVYEHEIVESHPLLEGLHSPLQAPHSRWYNVTGEEIAGSGVTVLIESERAGVHMAVDEDRQCVMFQGHPEYEMISLLKEYVRELGRYHDGTRDDYPPVPDNLFDAEALAYVASYRQTLEQARKTSSPVPEFDEAIVDTGAIPTWNRDGKIIYRNWMRGLLE